MVSISYQTLTYKFIVLHSFNFILFFVFSFKGPEYTWIFVRNNPNSTICRLQELRQQTSTGRAETSRNRKGNSGNTSS